MTSIIRLMGIFFLLFMTGSCSEDYDANEMLQEAKDLGVSRDLSDETDFASVVISATDADVDNAEWGRFLKYSEGTTYGTKDSLTGVAEINPGQEIHPPHVHAEEEYLMVLEGQGTWHLNGRDFPAKAGDMLYSRPWEIHGIKNTGDIMLKFVVWKWNSKGVAVMESPEESSSK